MFAHVVSTLIGMQKPTPMMLLVANHFTPETGGGAARARNLARALRSIGFLVHVFASHPQYPYGVVQKGCGYWGVTEDRGIRVNRTPLPPLPYRGAFSRLLIFCSFVFFSTLTCLRFRKENEFQQCVIFALNPPLFSTLVGLIMRRMNGGKLIVDIGDIWPDELDVLPGRFPRLIMMLSARFANVIQSKADVITVASSWLVLKLKPRFPNKTISLLPSGIPESELGRIDRRESKRKICHMIRKQSKSPLIVYAGSLGYAQPLKPLIMTAKRLQNVEFVICGSGELRQELRAFANKLQLQNVHFLEGLDRGNLELLLNAADLCILPHAPTRWAPGALPVKFFEYLGANRAILHYGARTEAADYIMKNNVGLFVEGFDDAQIATGIERIISGRLTMRIMERNIRVLNRMFDKAAMANLLSKMIRDTLVNW